MQIYKITNTQNNKIYIGKDTSSCPNYFGSGKLIKQSIKKYGINNFKKEIIENCDNHKVLCEREKYWIQYYNSNDLKIGYNISDGGDGGDTFTNNPNLEKIKKKISETMKKRIFTESHRKKLSENHMSTKVKKGKTYDEIYGKELAEEYRNKLKSARGKYQTEKERLGDKFDEVIEILRNKFKGDNNPMRKNKYYWYYNPITMESTRICENCKIPEGFIRGRRLVKGI